MMSSDTNIETIAQLVEVLKRYMHLQGEYVRLNIVDKVVRLLTAATISFVIVVLFMLALIYLSFAIVHTLEPAIGLAWAFAVVSAGYFGMLLLCVIFRKQWIERPLVKFLASLLMEN